MKKLLIIAVISMFACLAGCGDSNDEPDYPDYDEETATISPSSLVGKWEIESINHLLMTNIELNIPLVIHNIDVNKAQYSETVDGKEHWVGLYDGTIESSVGSAERTAFEFTKKVGSSLNSAKVYSIMFAIRKSPLSDDVIVVVLQDFHFKDGYLICDNSDIMYGSMPIDGDLEPTTMYAGTVKIKKIK